MANQTATVINLVKTALGAGMLALPYAFKCQGIALGVASLVFGAVTCVIGLMLLDYASGFLPAGQASFFQVAKITYPTLAVFFDVAIALKCFGVCISYLVIIGNLMPNITAYFGYETSQFMWLTIAIVIVTPICFQKSLESLKTASLVALSSVVYLLIIAVGHYFKGDTLSQKGPVSVWEPQSLSSVISTEPIITFAFTCAQNMFSIVNEMDDKSMSSVYRTTVISISIALVTYITVGLFGYLSFGNNVNDNVISMYSQSVSSTLGRFAIVILVLFSYPLMAHPARGSVASVIKAYHQRDPTATHLLGPEEITENPKEHAISTSIILVLSYMLANTLNSLDIILSFVGATGATAVSFILPGIFGYALSSTDRENRLVDLSAVQKKWVRTISILMAVWGIFVAVLAVGVNIVLLTKGQ